MTLAISKARMFSKSLPAFDEEYKKTQMKTRRLKKIWIKEGKEKSLEDFRLAQAEKDR